MGNTNFDVILKSKGGKAFILADTAGNLALANETKSKLAISEINTD